MTTIELLQKTKAAWPALSAAPAEEKNRLLLAMADALEESTPAILAANAQDMADAEGHISAVMLDRLRLDRRAAAIISGTPASETDFDTEFLNYILAVAVVDSLDDAIAHIAAHSTHHSDCIVTEDAAAAARFTRQVDSAAVYVNVSTRFTDGGEFGLGCEMGISTQKLHARGPMGLDELSTYKYVVTGDGQIR